MSIQYRPEIDGLRAISILPVIFFHAGFDIFKGGFVGVDVFFVISGYLITSIILNDLNKDNFSFKNFYERRARRILPPLILVLLITSIISFVFLTHSELSSYFQSVISSLLFFSNLYFYKTTPYFREEAEIEPLLHTWSLSIEEQFYIIFPITIFLLHKFFRKYIILFLFFVFFTSLFICQFLAQNTGGTLNFYFTLSRAWELTLGAACAFMIFNQNLHISTRSKNFISIIGISMIIFSILYFSKNIIYPSLYTLIPTFGTALIILFVDKNTLIYKILSTKLIVGIGLISYSLYLWHQPLLAFGRIYFENFSTVYKLIVLFLSLLLSLLSFNFVEKKFRNKNNVNLKNFLIFILTSTVFLLFFSYFNQKFFSSKNSTEALLAKLLIKNDVVYATKMDERQFIKNRIIFETLDPKILVFGSSRIMEISSKNFDDPMLNLGVSGASIQDLIALTEIALEKFNPDKILIGADPWLLNKYNNQARWNSISNEYIISLKNIYLNEKKNKILKNINHNNVYNFYEKLLEFFYNFSNIRNLDLEIKKDEIKDLTKVYILRDGLRVDKKNEKERILDVNIIKYSMDKYEFSEQYYNQFKSFVNYVVNVHNKKVILILSPYYPPSYELTIKEKPFYKDLEDKFRELSKNLNIQIIGSYDATKIPCEEREFYDYMHPKKSCMIKITNQLNQ